ncbi:hypothetical protein L210DRAFT_2552073 [Boletus edulis BED1]|uniref:Uncharacterized protein n=1 Tax=Boletus edulis BED1 TaxID=1328754 RepID=A0AAD4BNM1_BOLED|nr:hypothetical protein L210DRAFT_2552073 [Boletus edulis BED1]
MAEYSFLCTTTLSRTGQSTATNIQQECFDEYSVLRRLSTVHSGDWGKQCCGSARRHAKPALHPMMAGGTPTMVTSNVKPAAA